MDPRLFEEIHAASFQTEAELDEFLKSALKRYWPYSKCKVMVYPTPTTLSMVLLRPTTESPSNQMLLLQVTHCWQRGRIDQLAGTRKVKLQEKDLYAMDDILGVQVALHVEMWGAMPLAEIDYRVLSKYGPQLVLEIYSALTADIDKAREAAHMMLHTHHEEIRVALDGRPVEIV